MADTIDVQNVLLGIVEAAVYPTGTANPSITGKPVSLFPGYPASASLDKAIASGNTFISVWPTDQERIKSRYLRVAQVTTPAAPTITTTINGQAVTIGGTISSPQNVGLLVNGIPYVDPVQANDTLTSVATALAVLVAADIAGTTNNGPVVNVGATGRIQAARVSANGIVGTELKRQEKVFCVSVWAPDPATRDLIGGIVDVALAGLEFITLPDGFAGRLIYSRSTSPDSLEKTTTYQRNLMYSVEYPTTTSQPASQILFGDINLANANSTSVSVTI